MKITRIKEYYKSDKFPLILFVISMSLSHIFMQKNNDDLVFSAACNNTSLFQFLINRYNAWSSRIVIEGILVLFCEFLPMALWKITNIGMFALLFYSLSKLFITENKRNLSYILCICLISIPINILGETGWMATMNNYLWVVATGVFAMIPIYKIYKKEKIPLWQGFLFILATIYAANQEQMAGILFLVYTFFLIDFIRQKKYKTLIFVIYIIILLSLLFILTCPGNANRKLEEEKRWYPEYSELSLASKLLQGLSSMMDYVVQSGRIHFFALLILIAYVLWTRCNKKFYQLFGLIPLILSLGYRGVFRILIESKKQAVMQDSILFFAFKNIIYIFILISMAICIYKIFDNKGKDIKKYLPLLVYSVGTISRYIMAFSPTILASGERTAYFWYISICILIILIIKEKILNKEEETWENLKE